MKWIRPYALIVLLFSIIVFITSFYLMDVMPMIYKFYTGVEITPNKMDKLIIYGGKLIHDVEIIALFSMVTFFLLLFVKNIKAYLLFIAIALLVHFLLIAELTEYAIFKRLYKMFLMLPLLWIFFDYFKFRKERYEQKITNGFLYITLLFLILPGLYAPPFFSGIQGWVLQIDKKEPISIEGLFLVRKDGEQIRYSRGITNPIGFLQRVDAFFIHKHPDKVKELLNFYKQVYIKRYPLLKEGKMPNQMVMGNFPYPTHNPVGTFDYSKFPPESIAAIKIIEKKYSWDKKMIDEKILASEVW